MSEEKPEGKGPAGWRAKGPAVKSWSAGARTDDPKKRSVLGPTGEGLGKGRAAYFLFGFRAASPQDKVFVEAELEQLQDDFATLRAAGYTVVVDTEATQKDFLDTLAGKGEGAEGLAPTCLYWSAHGDEQGAMHASDGGTIAPPDVDPAKVHPGLRLVVFAACYVASRARTWRKQLGGLPLVVGWGNPVSLARAREFLQSRAETDTDLDDLLRRYVLAEEPLPPELPTGEGFSPAASLSGRVDDALAARAEKLAAQLGGRCRREGGGLFVAVPLESGRHQEVKLFHSVSAQPYGEGAGLVGLETLVGALSTVADASALLRDLGAPGYARVALVQGDAEAPVIVSQAFLPAGAEDRALLSALCEVARVGDLAERRIYGTDQR